MAKFEATSYSLFRVSYPEKLFESLQSYCGPFVFERPLRALDLGSGTGFSAQSFLSFFPKCEMTLVESDASMLEYATEHFKGNPTLKFFNQRAEDFEIEQAFDLVLIGSAWHWMERESLVQKFEASEVGAVFVFEYQFPKAKTHAELNEWVRRAFNLKWRTPNQEPRGNLFELTQVFRDASLFFQRSRVSFHQEEKFDLERFWGMIISQSRFLAYEQTLQTTERDAQKKMLYEELAKIWGPEIDLPFILPYEGFFFLRKKI